MSKNRRFGPLRRFQEYRRKSIGPAAGSFEVANMGRIDERNGYRSVINPDCGTGGDGTDECNQGQ